MVEVLLIVVIVAGAWLAYNYRKRPEWLKRKFDQLRGKKAP